MNFALLGGDDRTVRLARLLRADGHGVRAFALERALACQDSAAAAVEGADCIILPLPSETAAGALNAPLSEHICTPAEVLAAAAPGTVVCAGKAGEATRSACRRGQLALTDYLLREDFALKNAALTAEGALALLLQGDGALAGSRVCIVGFGRIGRLLARKLVPLGVRVTVAARRAEDRALAELLGCSALRPAQVPAGDWDAVVNTVPAVLYGAEDIAALGSARLIELASAPYGFDLAAARAQGKDVELASGLPGKCAPEAAAAAVRDTIYAILEG